MTAESIAALATRFAAAVAMLGAFGVPARADDFYRGKTLTLVVGYVVGGGADMYTRLLARISRATSPAIPQSSCRTCRARPRSPRSAIRT